MTDIRPILDAIMLAGKAAKEANTASANAKSYFQQVIGAIKAAKLENLFVVKAGNEWKPRDSRTLNDNEKKIMEQIRATAIKAYGWSENRIAASFRHWKFRIANELCGKAIAAQSKAQREEKKKAEKERKAAIIQELASALNAKNLKVCKSHIEKALQMLES